MGCFNSKHKLEEPLVIEKQYSWSNKEKVNPSDYMIENAKNCSYIKRPGDINGEQFIIQNCEFVNIGLFDFINTITIDDCNNCSIFVGPTIGSVVLRNCMSCRIMCCCQQFRSRDCKNVEVFLYCATQPAIESCNDITFGCFSAYYKGLEEHFKKANLSVLNNNWTNIYDFTLNQEERHYTLFSPTIIAEDYFSGIPTNDDIELSFNTMKSAVPKTLGSLPNANDESCLILINGRDRTFSTAIAFIKEMQNNEEIFLLKTKEFCAITKESQIAFGVEANQMIIALLYKGKDSIKKSQCIGKGVDGLSVISNPNTIYKKMSLIFNINN